VDTVAVIDVTSTFPIVLMKTEILSHISNIGVEVEPPPRNPSRYRTAGRENLFSSKIYSTSLLRLLLLDEAYSNKRNIRF